MSQWLDLYDTTFKTQRAAVTASDYSATGTETWADHLTDKLCALQPMSHEELERYGKVTPGVGYKMFTDETDILPRDRVVIGANNHEIVAVLNVAGRGEVTKCILWRPIEA